VRGLPKDVHLAHRVATNGKGLTCLAQSTGETVDFNPGSQRFPVIRGTRIRASVPPTPGVLAVTSNLPFSTTADPASTHGARGFHLSHQPERILRSIKARLSHSTALLALFAFSASFVE
jgi:hypothetical protein